MRIGRRGWKKGGERKEACCPSSTDNAPLGASSMKLDSLAHHGKNDASVIFCAIKHLLSYWVKTRQRPIELVNFVTGSKTG
jgi:hypothetical protein